MHSAAFLLPDVGRSSQEKSGILFKRLEWDRDKNLECLLYALSSQRKRRLERLGMNKYFLTVTFPLEQVVPVGSANEIGGGPHYRCSVVLMWPGKACFRGSSARTLQKSSRAHVGLMSSVTWRYALCKAFLANGLSFYRRTL